MRKITGDQVADAMALGGYPILKRCYFKTEDNIPHRHVTDDSDLSTGALIGACALGQAALNLGVSVYDLGRKIGLPATVAIANDNDAGRTLAQCARTARRHLKGTEFEVEERDWGMVLTNYQGRRI